MKQIKNYAWPVTAISKIVYDEFCKKIEENKEKFKDKKIVVFGAGIRGTQFSVVLENLGIEEFIFSDNNSAKWGGYINKYPIEPIEKIYNDKNDIFIFVTVEAGIEIKKQLIDGGFIENRNFVFLNPNIYDRYMVEFVKKEEIDVLVMGDCGMTHISLLDSNKSNLGEMIKLNLDKLKSKVLAMHGMGMRAFFNILSAQLYMGIKPKYLILETNFETFTSKHHYLPRTQHSELIKRVADISNLKSEELKTYVDITRERAKNLQIEFKSTNNTIQKRNSEELNAMYMKMNYMYNLKVNNEGIIYLLKILDLLKDENIYPILYIPPINFMRGEQYFGKDFYSAYESNCELLKKIVKDKGYDILDLSYSLEDKMFADIDTVDESANYNGRLKLCNLITKSIITKI